jgi:RNase P subunit RPR2
MIEVKVTRIVRDGEGGLLMKWVIAAIAEICDECSDPIKPGDEMVLYVEVDVTGAVLTERPRHKHIRRTYCKTCGALLEDSMTTTEAR